MTEKELREKIDLTLERFVSEVVACEYVNLSFEQRAKFRKVPVKVILALTDAYYKEAGYVKLNPDQIHRLETFCNCYAEGTAADSHCLYSIGHTIVQSKCIICGKNFKPLTNNVQVKEVKDVAVFV